MEAGDRVRVEKGKAVYEGVLMPSPTGSLVVKLDSGYNVGVRPGEARVTLLSKGRPPSSAPPPARPDPNHPAEDVHSRGRASSPAAPREGLPQVSILSTGGTIASRVDYRTGAVTSQFTAEELRQSIPELEEVARVRAEQVYSILSENMTPQHWVELAQRVAREIEGGARGVVVAHGTDTMAYTASALSLLLETPAPVVLVGSQRSSDRPSSDAALNALGAVRVALADLGEVVAVMHDGMSDEVCAIHRGTRVRKMHTSRRDAFHTIGGEPLGWVEPRSGRIELSPGRRPRGGDLKMRGPLEPRVGLVKFVPGAHPDLLESYRGMRGLVVEGTGLGHVSSSWIAPLAELSRGGMVVVMVSQCLEGRVCDRVYDTGRDLLKAGVVEGEDMLPETAVVKLMWSLGRAKSPEEARALFRQNIAGEYTETSRA